LLEILGKNYIVQHCVVFLDNKAKEMAYQSYIADCLKAIADNTANMYGGTTIRLRYADLISNEKPETRTEEEVINDIKEKLRAIK
jgi:metal-dependent amidase/aminoacylase/carboxypeptidase family protein